MARGKQGQPDLNETAFRVLQETVGDSVPDDDGKNPAAVALGRLGGLRGGKARAAKLSAEERSAIGKQGAEARWKRRA